MGKRPGSQERNGEPKRLTLNDLPFARLVAENEDLAEARRAYAGQPADERRLAAQWEYDAGFAGRLFDNAVFLASGGKAPRMSEDRACCPGAVLALAIDPLCAPALLTVGSVEYQLGRVDEAMSLFLVLPSLPPETEGLPEIIDKAGDVLCDERDFENGKALYAAAAEQHPGVALYHNGLSYCVGKLGETDEAVARARRAVALEPDDADYLTGLGWSLVVAECYDEAEQVLEKAVSLAPPGERLAKNNLEELRRRRDRSRRRSAAREGAEHHRTIPADPSDKGHAMSPKGPAITGTFRIVEAELWDQDYLDLVGEAYIGFDPDGAEEFRFGALEGCLDCRSGTREGKPAVEFTWEGFDEGDRVFGRGWAVLEAPDRLRGMFFFHMGDESAFVATRKR